MCNNQMRLADVVQLPVDPDNSGHVVGCVDADVARADVGLDEVDLEERSKEVNNDCVVEHV